MLVVEPLTPPVPMLIALVVALSVAPVAMLYVLAPVLAVNMLTVCAAVAVLPIDKFVAAPNALTVVDSVLNTFCVAVPLMSPPSNTAPAVIKLYGFVIVTLVPAVGLLMNTVP